MMFKGIPAGFIFVWRSGCLSASVMINKSQLSRIPKSALNLDNLAVKDGDDGWFKFVEGDEAGNGFYVSSDGTKIPEYDLYERMADEDETEYDALYGIDLNEFN